MQAKCDDSDIRYETDWPAPFACVTKQKTIQQKTRWEVIFLNALAFFFSDKSGLLNLKTIMEKWRWDRLRLCRTKPRRKHVSSKATTLRIVSCCVPVVPTGLQVAKVLSVLLWIAFFLLNVHPAAAHVPQSTTFPSLWLEWTKKMSSPQTVLRKPSNLFYFLHTLSKFRHFILSSL